MLTTALDFGANAVYAGQPRYSLRVRNNDFGKIETLQAGIDLAHEKGKKLYVVVNAMPHGAKIKTFLPDMAEVIALQPDALIMSDPGLIDLIKENFPEMPIHLSVQMNTVNAASARFWQKIGVSRIILSRELSLSEIADIREAVPDLELEVFVHGALCIAYSGRCLLSGYFNHRDANQGTCTNACRWQYETKPAEEMPDGQIVLIEEKERPGELMAMEEDEHGTYIMNSKDLRAIEYIDTLLKMGVNSFKIEGRTKSAYYVARTVQAYRKAIDDAVQGKAFDATLLHDLDALANRGYTAGFYERHAAASHQNYETGQSESTVSRYVGDVLRYEPERAEALIEVKNRFALGDTLELITPSGNDRFTVEALKNEKGQTVEVAPGSGHRVWMAIPKTANTALMKGEAVMLARLLEAGHHSN